MNRIAVGVKQFVKQIPGVRALTRSLNASSLSKRWSGSEDYWVQRYKTGGNSGDGSYNKLAQFKAEILNAFVKDRHAATVIEYGCGDGNQLRLAEYKSYLGFDVSDLAIAMCRKTFAGDVSKQFKLVGEYRGETAELTMSLDVVYHLVEDAVFESYIRRLFDSSSRFVIVYSSNKDEQEKVQSPHVKHRKFTRWVEENTIGWKLVQHIPNKYPYNGGKTEGSFADFYIFEKSM